jgi:hypothetical protein
MAGVPRERAPGFFPYINEDDMAKKPSTLKAAEKKWENSAADKKADKKGAEKLLGKKGKKGC